MIKWLGASIVAMLMVIVLISQEQAGAGMAPVGDEDLAEITAQTGINLYGSLKATAGNLIIASTAGRLKLGGWRLNNATPATADPSNSASVGFSQWGPFSINVGYFNSPTQGKRAVLRIGLDARVNENAPTWIFKNIQMWQDEDWSDYSGEPYFDGTDCLRDQPSTGYLWNYNWDSSNTLTHLVEGTYAGGHNNYSASNHGEAGWIDIGGLYLTSIHLWQSYIDLFNDSATSVSQIQGYGRFFGTVEKVTIQWGANYLDGAAVIDNLTFSRTPVSSGGTTGNYMILGNAAGGDPLVWDQTSNFRDTSGTISMNNMRIWFPFEGSLTWDNFAFRDLSYTRASGRGGGDAVDANGYLNLGALEVNHLKGTITIDFPQQENPSDGGWWNY